MPKATPPLNLGYDGIIARADKLALYLGGLQCTFTYFPKGKRPHYCGKESVRGILLPEAEFEKILDETITHCKRHIIEHYGKEKLDKILADEPMTSVRWLKQESGRWGCFIPNYVPDDDEKEDEV